MDINLIILGVMSLLVGCISQLCDYALKDLTKDYDDTNTFIITYYVSFICKILVVCIFVSQQQTFNCHSKYNIYKSNDLVIDVIQNVRGFFTSELPEQLSAIRMKYCIFDSSTVVCSGKIDINLIQHHPFNIFGTLSPFQNLKIQYPKYSYGIAKIFKSNMEFKYIFQQPLNPLIIYKLYQNNFNVLKTLKKFTLKIYDKYTSNEKIIFYDERGYVGSFCYKNGVLYFNYCKISV